MEIPYASLVEFTVNALVHRSLNAKAPTRIFIFDDRVEIHSPGTLPNGLTVEDIVTGTSMPRNMFLFTNAIHLLPYTGAGSGMLRALSEDMKVSFINNNRTNEFVVIINRQTDNSDTPGDDSDTKKISTMTLSPSTMTSRAILTLTLRASTLTQNALL